MKTKKNKYKRKLKTPISYYGGKQRLLKEIIPRLPQHSIYVEPFFGGGAVFFGKEPSMMEIINDIDDNVINFYKVLQTNYKGLKSKIKTTLHSRSIQQQANAILYHKKKSVAIEKAWAFWVMCTMSYSNNPSKNAGFAYDKKGSTTKKFSNAKEHLLTNFSTRLEHVQIENTDALKVIESRDSKDTFFYIDPPYLGSDCGSYKGYTEAAFKQLLELLTQIKGKFLLSSYPHKLLETYRKQAGWKHQKLKKRLQVYGKRKRPKYKTECLTGNYDWSTNSVLSPKKEKREKDLKPMPTTNRTPDIASRLVKRYCNLDGKLKTKTQIALFLTTLQNAIKRGAIRQSHRYATSIEKIQDNLISLLGKYSGLKTKWILIKLHPSSKEALQQQLSSSGIAGVAAQQSEHFKIMRSTDIVNLHFEKLGFAGKWKRLIGDPSKGFTAMIYGKPKMGKSYLSVDFGGYLARNHGTVLYVAREEGSDDTLQKKLKDKNVAHPDFYVSDYLPEDISKFDFVFLDSVNKLGLTPENLERLKQKIQKPHLSIFSKPPNAEIFEEEMNFNTM